MNNETFEWESVVLQEYVKFIPENNNTVNVTFIDNNPVMERGKYGLQYVFQVIEDNNLEKIKLFSISSNRLMVKLKELIPLEGKTFCIKRDGKDYDTDYQVLLIPKADQKTIEG